MSNYKNLLGFISCWFADWEFENLSDEQIVKNYLKVAEKKYVKIILKEIELALSSKDILYKEFSKESNIYFSTKEECLLWLEKLKNFFNKYLN